MSVILWTWDLVAYSFSRHKVVPLLIRWCLFNVPRAFSIETTRMITIELRLLIYVLQSYLGLAIEHLLQSNVQFSMKLYALNGTFVRFVIAF